MNPTEAADFQCLLARLMEEVRANPTLTPEVHRAEREFFQANPTALQQDANAPLRFGEWFILERESDVLGGIPAALLAMADEERICLEDSMVGVFQVTGKNGGEHVVVDLQDDRTHDVAEAEGLDVSLGDLIIGRLFDGPLDVYIASVAMALQRDASALAAAFTEDTRAMDLGRRLSQAEIEHLLFRGRGQAGDDSQAAEPTGVPIEHLEADLEKCLTEGGIDPDDLSPTTISASLGGIPRPGLIIDPLLEKIAFDSEVDLEAAREIMLQIWQQRQLDSQQVPVADDDSTAGELGTDTAPAEDRRASSAAGEQPPADRGVDSSASGLGASIRARIDARLADGEDLEQVFAEADEMVGEPDVLAEEDEVLVDGNMRPLIAEYLWETEADRRGDTGVLEQLVVIQCEAPVPYRDLEDLTSSDLLRLLMQTYLGSTPGARTAQVGEAFAVLERFFGWCKEAQGFESAPLLDSVREDFLDHVARLDAAGLALSGTGPLDDIERNLFRVVTVAPDALEIAIEEGDDLVRVELAGASHDKLWPEDLLLTAVQVGADGTGKFIGMVVAMPPVARDLLG